MAYLHDRVAPLPALREIHIGAEAPVGIDAPVAETPSTDTCDVDENSMHQPAEVENSSTRAGGTDLHPKLNPLREVHIDRTHDARKNQGYDSETSKDVGDKAGAAFIPMAMWVIVAVFLFWIYCQLFPVFYLPFNRFGVYWAIGCCLFPLALLAFVSFRVYLLFRKLPSFPQIHKEKDKGKDYAIKEKLLHGYLEELPKADKYAASAGFEDVQKEEIVKILNLLRGKGSHYSDEVGWLADFRRFQELQRTRANKIIGIYSTLIGLKTAASPWKLVDIICVFLNSTLMVADLAKLYNRRVDRSAAFRLVFRWFLNIYISGELGQISTKAAEAIGEQLKEPVKDSLSDLGWLDGDWAGTVAQSMPFIAKFAGKIVEGGVNAYFAIRMGRKAVAAFEPLISDQQ